MSCKVWSICPATKDCDDIWGFYETVNMAYELAWDRWGCTGHIREFILIESSLEREDRGKMTFEIVRVKRVNRQEIISHLVEAGILREME